MQTIPAAAAGSSSSASTAGAPQTQPARLAAVGALLPRFRERARVYDDASAFPAENFADLRAAGLLSLTVPVEHGGHGLWQADRFADYYEILETIAKADPSTAQLLQVHSHATAMLAWHASPEQRARFLPEVVERGKLIASAGSEVDPKSKSSDPIRAELQPVDGGHRLSCVKHFVSLGASADYFLIWTAVPGSAPASERQLFALVPRDGEGVEMVNEWDVLGMRSTVSWGVKITDHFVPPERLIGTPGCWVRDPRTFTLAYVANHLGSAEGAFEAMLEFVRERPYLAQSETVKAAIGDLASRLYAAHSALYTAARQWERAGAADWVRPEIDRAEMMSLQALHIAKRCALDVSERVFDVCGARAAFRTLPLEQIYRDVRTFTLHFRDDLYMIRVAEGLLDPLSFEAKGKYKRLDRAPIPTQGA